MVARWRGQQSTAWEHGSERRTVKCPFRRVWAENVENAVSAVELDILDAGGAGGAVVGSGGRDWTRDRYASTSPQAPRPQATYHALWSIFVARPALVPVLF